MAQEPLAAPAMGSVNYFHVDVFATRPLTGNGLAVFLDTATWSVPSLQRVALEMRQFESIFLSEVSATGATALRRTPATGCSRRSSSYAGTRGGRMQLDLAGSTWTGGGDDPPARRAPPV
jgi:hypothetical protein